MISDAARIERSLPRGRLDTMLAAARKSWPLWLSSCFIIGSVIQQAIIGLDTDVSWLITVCERLLAGDRLYVDVVELNPPASVFVYLPWVALAGMVEVKPELVTALFIFVLASASLALTARILLRPGLLTRSVLFQAMPVAVMVCLLLPGASFAQREHIALLTLLPFAAMAAARAEKASVGVWPAVMAGIGAGIAVSIKPHFALAPLLMIAFSVWRRRSIGVLLQPEHIAAVSVVIAYVATVAIFFSKYFTIVVPLVRDGYLLARASPSQLLFSPELAIFATATVAALLLRPSKAHRGLVAALLLGAGGFALAMLIQGKGYANHLYPQVALALLALGIAVAGGRTQGAERIAATALLLAVAGLGVFSFAQVHSYRAVAQIVERQAPQGPTVMLAGTNLSIGHPLTRWVGGRWVASRGSLWATGTGIGLLRQTANSRRRAKLQAAIEEDRRIWVADAQRALPDVILVEGEEGRRWLRRYPDVARVMEPYRLAGEADGIFVMVRVSGLNELQRRVHREPNQAKGRP